MIIDPQKLIELVDRIKEKDAEIDRLRGVLAFSELENARLTQLATDYGRKAYALEAALAAGRITQALYDESIALASSFDETSKREDRYLCANCDTYLPKGCGGSFLNQRECMLNARKDVDEAIARAALADGEGAGK